MYALCYSLYLFVPEVFFKQWKKNKPMALFSKASGKIFLEDILELCIRSLKTEIRFDSVVSFVGDFLRGYDL